MSGSITIRQAELVLPERVVTGDVLIEDGTISEIGPSLARSAGEVINGRGLTLLPGVMDPQVHFRDPGLTHKECLTSGSRAAAAGGITAFLDMPNTTPNTSTVTALHDKLELASRKSCVHYGFFMGATGENIEELNAAERTCGIKIFMGASTGNLLVSDHEVIEGIFAQANKLIAVHAENNQRLIERYQIYHDSTEPKDHPIIRDVETALSATLFAVGLSLKYGQRLHVLHLTSGDEADYLASVPRGKITCEVCPQHLFLHAEDAYERLGTKAQCNPPVRSKHHANVLWKRLVDGTINCIATDHAPHTLDEKARPFPKSPSGMPGVEWALPLMLNQVNTNKANLPDVARWMCEAPAQLYGVPRKGRLETGYDGDLVLVDMQKKRTISNENVRSRCGWTPYEGFEVQGWPVLTAVLGEPVFRDGEIIDGVRGRELTFVR
jgi:dihydroorotase